MAAHNNNIRTNYVKSGIDKTQENNSWKESVETVNRRKAIDLLFTCSFENFQVSFWLFIVLSLLL